MIFNKVLFCIRGIRHEPLWKSTRRRSISHTPVMEANPRALAKFKKRQAEFQCENGVPIFLKAGILDRVLYSVTVLLAGFGVSLVIMTIYDFAKPASWRE